MEVKQMKEKKEILDLERVKNLRESLLSFPHEICIERARIVTESYKKTQGEPVVIRRAKALEKVLNEMSIYIRENEIIVGNMASKPWSVPIFPEYSVDWIEEELKGEPCNFETRLGDNYSISKENKEELLEILKWWEGKTHQDRVLSILPQEATIAQNMGAIFTQWLMVAADGHIIPDYPKLLRKGLKGIIAEAEEILERLDLSDPEDFRKRTFLQAAIISCKAVIDFAGRYGERARALAGKEISELRKKELERIAEICEYVPANPARTFYEALQSVIFLQFAVQIEANGGGISLGRFDQYMYPFYSQDLQEGRLIREKTLELLECFWLKLNEAKYLKDAVTSNYFRGYIIGQNLTIGGQTIDGKDAVNDLSYLCLESEANIRFTEPFFVVRYFSDTSESFLRKCCEVIRMGFGKPAMINDEVAIPSLLSRGIRLEDAYDYSLVGCIEPSVPGKWGGRTGGTFFNIGKWLEMALNNGTDPRTGHQLLPEEKNLSTFAKFEDVWEAFEKQANYYLKLGVISDNAIDFSFEEVAPTPLLSSLINDCIKRGKGIQEGGAIYDFTGGVMVGAPSAANSLAAIKKVVFEDKIITGSQLKHHLKFNFEDNTTDPSGKKIQQILMKAPKFGNDIDYVDELASKIYEIYATISKYKNTKYGRGPIGGKFLGSTPSLTSAIIHGKLIGATADGRKAGEAVAEGTSPYHGTDICGPTAVLKSVGKMPNIKITYGQLLNMKLSPASLRGEEGLIRLATLIKTFFSILKGFHVQFNVVSAEELKDAQKHPEKHRNLVVRVAGYSAQFIILDREVQNDIIARTEHELQV